MAGAFLVYTGAMDMTRNLWRWLRQVEWLSVFAMVLLVVGIALGVIAAMLAQGFLLGLAGVLVVAGGGVAVIALRT